MSGDRGLLRNRREHEHHKVGFVELFFDLVFVLAVTQLSHSLIEDFSLLGRLEALLLLLAVWWVWIYTAWVTNWLDPEKLPVRVALLVLMLPGLILSSSIPHAFGSRGLAFAGAYAAMQVGRTLFFIWAVQGHPGMVRNFQRILAWLVLGAAFWIAGALVEGSARLALWGMALGLDFVSPGVGFWVPGLGRSTTADWDVEGGHMAERCGLFIIIALGESILVTGATFSGMPWTAGMITAFFVSVVGSLAMWWLYFDTTAEVGSRTIAGSEDPGRLARLAYTYIHLLLVAGIVLTAVGDELVLAHPSGHADARIASAVLGGPASYLTGSVLFRWAIAGRAPLSPLVGVLVLALLFPVSAHTSPLMLMAYATGVLVAIAAWEAKVRRSCPRSELAVE